MKNTRAPLEAFDQPEFFQQESLPELTADRIKTMISNGMLMPGSQLPNEVDLAEAMGVSRGTIRSALALLQQQGLIWRRQGVGSFISETPILENRLDINSGVTDLIESMGLDPGTKVVEIKVIQSDKHNADLLNLLEGSPVVSLRRIRTASGQPVVASLDIIPISLLERSISGLSLDKLKASLEKEHSLYRILEKELGVTIDYGIAKIRPIKVNPQMTRNLGIELPAGSVMLYIEQVDYDRNRNPIAVSYEYHVADFCAFTVYRRRS